MIPQTPCKYQVPGIGTGHWIGRHWGMEAGGGRREAVCDVYVDLDIERRRSLGLTVETDKKSEMGEQRASQIKQTV